jgi:hypothetical protein
MTMPSFPNLPVLFPDEAVFLNQKGFRPPMATIQPPRLHFFTNPEDPSEIVKKGWDAQSRKVVMDGLANNKSKELGMLGRKGLKVMPDASLTGLSGLSGGAVTKEGRQMAREFLKTRARNYAETRDASFFSPTAKTTGTTLAPPDTRQLYITLLSIADEIQVGNITDGTLSKLNSATSSLLQVSPVLSGKQMGEIVDFLTNMVRSSQVLVFRESLDAAKRRTIASVISQLERMYVIITEMAKTESPKAREIIGRQILSTFNFGENIGDLRELEPAESTLFRELNPSTASPLSPPPPPRPRRGRPPNSEYMFPRVPEGQQTLDEFPFAKRFSSTGSTATGSTGNPRAVLSPTSAAVEQALASSGLPPMPTRGEGRYRRGRKY